MKPSRARGQKAPEGGSLNITRYPQKKSKGKKSGSGSNKTLTALGGGVYRETQKLINQKGVDPTKDNNRKQPTHKDIKEHVEGDTVIRTPSSRSPVFSLFKRGSALMQDITDCSPGPKEGTIGNCVKGTVEEGHNISKAQCINTPYEVQGRAAQTPVQAHAQVL
ncbi:hypothetical protein NDU88_011833 [Pleurodeles waltl]|uniref:Uncharacterized protein n=1 Tax=Pleurodeles waltl TaxID=8319 RepID=A0AAV7R1J2_PLEWA|nr:hypothetical protein NDU88_011833 [Pleurodeles waltl]